MFKQKTLTGVSKHLHGISVKLVTFKLNFTELWENNVSVKWSLNEFQFNSNYQQKVNMPVSNEYVLYIFGCYTTQQYKVAAAYAI